uniref:Uncharacterized protein n=1 Tax=Avena sativa TaxID=4498 RepID=A0ACD5TJP0_AVESA
MSCRSSGGNAASSSGSRGSGSSEGEASSPVAGAGSRGGSGVMSSRVKKALGLKPRRSAPAMVRTLSQTSGPASPGRARRPMTSAEIMRQQMRVTEHSDARLRRTLMRAVVGQVGRRPDSIVLPLELLRQLKPSEFSDAEEYHQWQFRQIKLLEAGLVLHPSLPLDRLHAAVLRFREVMRATEIRAIDTGKGSEAMRALTNAVHALAWRPGSGSDCHWADGYPLNVLLYVSLLQTVFDLREPTVVLDEVDELLELIKKTWAILGVGRAVHNVCFAWVFFQQYVVTGQVEQDLVAAALTLLADVAADAKQGSRESQSRDPVYAKVLLSALGKMQEWSEKRLLDYHDRYEKGMGGGSATEGMEILLSMALAAGKIVADREYTGTGNFPADRVDYYIRCSMKNAFTKILENGMGESDGVITDRENDPGAVLTRLARDSEQLAIFERRNFSPLLRRLHPAPVAVAAVTLHGCFGVVLRRYLCKVTILTEDLVRVLHSASRLEKALAQMTAEDAADCRDDRAKAIVSDMEPYEVESVVMGLLKAWMVDRLRVGRDCLLRAKETESWIPKSKDEPFPGSAIELMKLARATIDEFSDIPATSKDDVVQELVDGLESIFQDYISFVASCGSKQSYVPPLPALTRCNQDSGFFRLWKKAVLPSCQAPEGSPRAGGSHHTPRPSISRGTQRLYVRLNTLHYVLTHVQAIDKTLSSVSCARGGGGGASPAAASGGNRVAASVHFDRARAAAQLAVSHVAEVSAYRLIFLDSRHSFYHGLYVRNVADTRIRPALRALKQNLSFLVSVLADRAQPVAVREVMKASFQAFLMVLLAGGNGRSFTRADHGMVDEDFRSLKRAFCTCGEGLVPEEVVAREAEAAEGVVELMARSTEHLIGAFGAATSESIAGAREYDDGGGATPVPPTSRQWEPADPNTILRVLCHRDDEVANQFLKRRFQFAKRR